MACAASANDLRPVGSFWQPLLRPIAGLELAVIFGSVSRAAPTAESDIDIAILGTADCDDSVALCVSAAMEREVDVCHLEGAGVPLLREVLRDGIVVFERTPGTHARFLSRALLTLETDGPWYDRMRDAALRRIARQGDSVAR